MTDTGIYLLDLYLLSYSGMKIIFQVCKTTKKSVFLIELATKRYKGGYTLTDTFHATKSPLIVVDKNVFTKSTYEVPATRKDKKLPIRILYGSRAYNEATKYVKYPKFGTFLAVPFLDYMNTYWKAPKKLKCDIDKFKELN